MPTNVAVPSLGESITEATLLKWHKSDGDQVTANEPIAELETDKANVDLPAPTNGILRRVKEEGDTVRIGDTIARIDESGAPATQQSQPPKPTAPAVGTTASSSDQAPSVRRMTTENKIDPSTISGTGRGGRVTKEDVQKQVEKKPESAPGSAPASKDSIASDTPVATETPVGMQFDAAGQHRSPMTRIRKRIAENLVKAQQTAAILTTFNEVDLQQVMDVRAKYKERFQEVYGVGLGIMSFFCRATILALREFPRVNAFLDGDNVVYNQNVHLGIAVSTERGLAVPVLKKADQMSFSKIESEIKRLANATRDGKLGLEELAGGTFTITNGGVFGSLLSTPILNPPQSAILGMHTIQKRPVVVNDKIEIRPMMYVALSYDHRLIDGRESVSFLVRVKQFLEDPTRLMLEI